MMAMIDDIIKTLVDELREMPDGTETTVYRLIESCGYDAKQLERDDELFTVYGDLCKAARKAHITLDWSAYKDMVVGLPYNIPFIVRNTHAQIKCPRCGSKHTARILYGMPAMSEELEAKINARKIHIGGCCITGYDERYYCNDCKKKFGAIAYIEDGNSEIPTVDAVTEFSFSRTVYMRPFQPSKVTIKKTVTGAHVQVNGAADDLPFEREYDITSRKWETLTNALYTDMFLSDWKHRFNDYSVLDGEEWMLTIKLTGGKKRTYSGSNGYPPYWEELVKLMRPYLKIK